MPLNSVQKHVLSVIDGIALPGQPAPLTAWIAPPAVEALDGPRAYVWGGQKIERRQTAPRGMGFKRLTWTVDVYLLLETTTDDTKATADLSQEFPLVIDAIENALRAAPMPVMLEDATTGTVSQLLAIGEDMDLEYPPERLAATVRLALYSARIGVTVEEALQA